MANLAHGMFQLDCKSANSKQWTGQNQWNSLKFHILGDGGMNIVSLLFRFCWCAGLLHMYIYIYLYWRKFRSETSDNMDNWTGRGGKSQRGEEKKWEDKRRKKMQVREKVGKSRFIVFLQWFVALEGRKVGLLKRRVQSHLARWEMKNCTPLWLEAHFQVKSVKNWRSRNKSNA